MKKVVTVMCVGVAIAACRTDPAPEPRPDPTPQSQQQQQPTLGSAQGTQTIAPSAPTTMTVASVPVSPDDPVHGNFSLADATRGLAGTGDLVATIDTSHGKMTCKLLSQKAPITVANFVGLARGTRPWKDPRTGTWQTNKPAYDGTTFHRIIKGFMIQGGDAKGNGSGEPGYVIPDEVWPGAHHDHAGSLCMANRGPNTNGAQFFITDAAAAHLDRSYTIFGECEPEAVIHMIAGVPTGPRDEPASPVTINKITIAHAASGSGTTPFAGAALKDASAN